MKFLKLALLALSLSSLSVSAAMRLHELTFSTPHMDLTKEKTQVVSLDELKSLLKQLSSTGSSTPVVRMMLVEGVLTSPPTRGMAQVNQGTRLKIKSEALNMEKSITLRPDIYNRIPVDLARAITSENDISDLILESESRGMIGDLRLSFVIDYE